MSPQPYFDQGDVYFCSFHLADIEQDDPACEEGQDYNPLMKCGQCPYCEKQSYRIVVQNPDQKHLISPERK